MLEGAAKQVFETGKRLWAIDEVGHCLDLRRRHAGRDVHQGQVAHEVRVTRGENEARESTEGHADHQSRVRSMCRHRSGNFISHRCERVLTCLAPGRVTMTGKVDGQEVDTEVEGHGVPGVRVLSPAMNEDELRIARSPLQCRDLPSVRQ